MLSFPVITKDFKGRRIILTEDRWRHITFKHPEVGSDPAILISCIENPEELYIDRNNTLHALIRQEDHFLLVIFTSHGDEGYIRTCYIINERRKKRRYGKLHRMKLS